MERHNYSEDLKQLVVVPEETPEAGILLADVESRLLNFPTLLR